VGNFTVTNDWGSGAVVTLTITNTGGAPVTGWDVDFDLPVNITSAWNVELSENGSGYTASDLGWNGTIGVGESVTFGFQTDGGGLDEEALNEAGNLDFGTDTVPDVDPPVVEPEPEPEPTPTPEPEPEPEPEPTPDPDDDEAALSAEFDVVNDWGSGATISLTITNNGDTAVDDWMLAFDFKAGITNSWNAELFADGDGYTASDLGYNGQIEAGETVTIGFNSDTGDLDAAVLNTEADFVFG